jgi:hypothetical protein
MASMRIKNVQWAVNAVYGSLGQLIFERKQIKMHSTSVRPNLANKPLNYWKDKEERGRRMELDAPSNSIYSLEKMSLASSTVA